MLGLYNARQALQLAEDRGLDLIEIAPNATPPTCKIMDYGKWKYEAKKKEKESKKKQTVITVKEIQIRPRTDAHDLQTKLKHARRFLLEGDKVKFNLRFQGREMVHQEVGVAALNRVVKDLLELAIIETPPKQEGKQMFTLLAPDPIKIKEYRKKMGDTEETKPLEKEGTKRIKSTLKEEAKSPKPEN